MGSRDWPAVLAELDEHRGRVTRHFRLVVFGGAEPDEGAVRIDLGRFWDSQAETAALAEALAGAGFEDSAEAARLLLELRSSSLVRRLDEPGRKRLQALLPALLADVSRSGAQLPVLRRILAIIEATGKRSAYFALLKENAAARARLVELCGHGEFLAAQIAAEPCGRCRRCHRRRTAQDSSASSNRAWSSCARKTPSSRWRRCGSSSGRRCFASPSPISAGRCLSCRCQTGSRTSPSSSSSAPSISAGGRSPRSSACHDAATPIPRAP